MAKRTPATLATSRPVFRRTPTVGDVAERAAAFKEVIAVFAASSTTLGSTPLDPRYFGVGLITATNHFYVFTYANNAATAATVFASYQTWQEVMSVLPADLWSKVNQTGAIGLKTILS